MKEASEQQKNLILDLLTYCHNEVQHPIDRTLFIFKIPSEFEQHEMMPSILETKFFIATKETDQNFLVGVEKKEYGYFCSTMCYNDEKEQDYLVETMKKILEENDFSDLPLEEYCHTSIDLPSPISI